MRIPTASSHGKEKKKANGWGIEERTRQERGRERERQDEKRIKRSLLDHQDARRLAHLCFTFDVTYVRTHSWRLCASSLSPSLLLPAARPAFASAWSCGEVTAWSAITTGPPLFQG